MTLIIGFTGKKRSGKDTAASIMRELADLNGLTAERAAFADPLKDELAEIVSHGLRLHKVNTTPLSDSVLWQVIRHEMDDPDTKHKYRLGLQWWGTEIRRAIDPDYWLRRMQEAIESLEDDGPVHLLTVTDVRFQNEADFIHRLGGIVYRVDRPGLPDDDTHASEVEINKVTVDGVIRNDKDLSYLRVLVRYRFDTYTKPRLLNEDN